MKVQFAALIQKLEARIDDSGDKVGKLTLGFRDEKKMLAKLDNFFHPNKSVKVTVEDEDQG